MGKDIATAQYVWVLRWEEDHAQQMLIFDDIEAAEDMAEYIKASRGKGTVTTMMAVYGKFYVSQVTGKEYA
jgi:hypothetical protein